MQEIYRRKLTSLVVIGVFLAGKIHLGKTQNISDGLNDFSIDLLTNTALELADTANLAISPYTVWTLLSTADEGARGNTARQLETVLRIPNEKSAFRKAFTDLSANLVHPDPAVNLQLSNAIFTTSDQKLKQQFRDVSKKFYGVDVKSINFRNTNEASQNINNYVARATKNRIQTLASPEDLIDAQIYMTSTLYFKGAWKAPFNRTETRRSTFFDENNKPIGEVDMMYQKTFFPFARINDLQTLAIELPYGNSEKMSMVVLLPFRGNGLINLLHMLTKTSFEKVLDHLNKAKEEYADDDVKVYLPKFAIMSDLFLNVVLDKMGVRDVFNSQTADLLGMFPHYLFISKLVQKAEIEVSEEGSVASAATGAGFAYKSPPPKFEANKPFLYFIVDKPTRSIIFAGKFSSPPKYEANSVKTSF